MLVKSVKVSGTQATERFIIKESGRFASFGPACFAVAFFLRLPGGFFNIYL
jgi:hypothetical protein